MNKRRQEKFIGNESPSSTLLQFYPLVETLMFLCKTLSGLENIWSIRINKENTTYLVSVHQRLYGLLIDKEIKMKSKTVQQAISRL